MHTRFVHFVFIIFYRPSCEGRRYYIKKYYLHQYFAGFNFLYEQ